MESNSKAGKIHISSSANHYLMEADEGFVTESRGEVLIKGKGTINFHNDCYNLFINLRDDGNLLACG
jgi:hypothetical protein